MSKGLNTAHMRVSEGERDMRQRVWAGTRLPPWPLCELTLE